MLAVVRRQETLVRSQSKCTEEYFCVKPASRGASGSRAAFPVVGIVLPPQYAASCRSSISQRTTWHPAGFVAIT